MGNDMPGVDIPYVPQPPAENLPVFNDVAAGQPGSPGSYRARINPLEGLLRAGDEARELIDRALASDQPDYAKLAGRLTRKLETVRFYSAHLLEAERERGSSAGGFTP